MLLKNENQIIRVLKSHGNKALVIDCIKRTMPKWVEDDFLSNFDDCGEDEMYERTDYPFGRELTPKEERITLIENRFNGKSLAAVQTMQKARKQTVNAATAENLQAQIDLAEHIQVIASKGKQTDVGIKNIRSTRKREQARTHIDFIKEGNICG